MNQIAIKTFSSGICYNLVIKFYGIITETYFKNNFHIFSFLLFQKVNQAGGSVTRQVVIILLKPVLHGVIEVETPANVQLTGHTADDLGALVHHLVYLRPADNLGQSRVQFGLLVGPVGLRLLGNLLLDISLVLIAENKKKNNWNPNTWL